VTSELTRHRNPGAPLELLRLPFQRRRQPQVIQNARPQLGLKSGAPFLIVVSMWADIVRVCSRSALSFLGSRLASQWRSIFKPVKACPSSSLDLTGNPDSLILAHVLQVNREGPQLLVRLAQILHGPPAFGPPLRLPQSPMHRRRQAAEAGFSRRNPSRRF